jgi:hypothetical protein
VPSNLGVSVPEGDKNGQGHLRVKAVVTDHGETLFREGALALQDVIKILYPMPCQWHTRDPVK